MEKDLFGDVAGGGLNELNVERFEFDSRDAEEEAYPGDNCHFLNCYFPIHEHHFEEVVDEGESDSKKNQG